MIVKNESETEIEMKPDIDHCHLMQNNHQHNICSDLTKQLAKVQTSNPVRTYLGKQPLDCHKIFYCLIY